MIEVRQTETFRSWLQGLRDRRARIKIVSRIVRIEDGNFGDFAPVGDGVSELRIHYGPGYRVYSSCEAGTQPCYSAAGTSPRRTETSEGPSR